MTVSAVKRLKALDRAMGTPPVRVTLARENARLKKLLAGQMLDLAAMKELVSKKW